jgi:hypothetical protein
MRPLDRVLERARGARKTEDGWLVSCPLPSHGKGNGDKNPSVSVAEGSDATALVKCMAGCDTEAVVFGWGLGMKDLFERKGAGGLVSLRETGQHVNGPKTRAESRLRSRIAPPT